MHEQQEFNHIHKHINQSIDMTKKYEQKMIWEIQMTYKTTCYSCFIIPYYPVMSTHCANDQLSAEHVLRVLQIILLLSVQHCQCHASFLSKTPPLTITYIAHQTKYTTAIRIINSSMHIKYPVWWIMNWTYILLLWKKCSTVTVLIFSLVQFHLNSQLWFRLHRKIPKNILLS